MVSLQESLARERFNAGEHPVRVEGAPTVPPPQGHGWSYDPGAGHWIALRHTPWGLWDRPLW
jgi:hypothetical protein